MTFVSGAGQHRHGHHGHHGHHGYHEEEGEDEGYGDEGGYRRGEIASEGSGDVSGSGVEVKAATRSELGEVRQMIYKGPMKGSILDQFKQHWQDEEQSKSFQFLGVYKNQLQRSSTVVVKVMLEDCNDWRENYPFDTFDTFKFIKHHFE